MHFQNILSTGAAVGIGFHVESERAISAVDGVRVSAWTRGCQFRTCPRRERPATTAGGSKLDSTRSLSYALQSQTLGRLAEAEQADLHFATWPALALCVASTLSEPYPAMRRGDADGLRATSAGTPKVPMHATLQVLARQRPHAKAPPCCACAHPLSSPAGMN